MRAPWLATVLRGAGLTVVEHGRWQGRGYDMGDINGVVVHDTVTTTGWTDLAVADLLRDGRPDLSGPLSQMGLDRQGRFWLIADGKSNHNGYGTWGNDALGIEVFCAGGLAGREEPWNAIQRDAAAVGAAAILTFLDLPSGRCQGHKEQDPNRKIDPYAVDMDRLRGRISQLIADPDAAEVEDNPYMDISKGDRGPAVRKWQRMCNRALSGKPSEPLTDDGHYGDGTAAALQKALGTKRPVQTLSVVLMDNLEARVRVREIRRALKSVPNAQVDVDALAKDVAAELTVTVKKP